MKLNDLNEAEETSTVDTSASTSTVTTEIKTASIDPVLRRSLTKLANNKKLTREELEMVIGTFKQLITTQPTDAPRMVRILQRFYR